MLKSNDMSFPVSPKSLRKFTVNFPQITNFSRSSVNGFFSFFPKSLYLTAIKNRINGLDCLYGNVHIVHVP